MSVEEHATRPHGQIPYYTTPNLIKPGLTHAFFGRQGGVSTSPYNSLNCTFRDDERSENVYENRRLILSELKAPPDSLVTLNQIHSNQVHLVNHKPKTAIPCNGDALVTTHPNLMLGVRTADCLPILLADMKNKVIAAVHAGWRGLLSEIIPKTLNLMCTQGAQRHLINAAIGPHIHMNNYEVGSELKVLFTQESQAWDQYFIQAPNNKFMLNLGGIAQAQLNSEGVANVDVVSIDTFENPLEFFSCRKSARSGDKRFGCQLSTIMLE